MSWPAMLSPKESKYVYWMLKHFYTTIKTIDTPPNKISENDWKTYKFQLAGLISMIESGITLDDAEVIILKWTMEFMLDSLPEEEWDEYMEKAYFRFFKIWYLDPPYFTKRDGLKLPDDFPRDGQI